MKVSEMIKELQKYPPDAEVVTDRARDCCNGFYKADVHYWLGLVFINHKPPESWKDENIHYLKTATNKGNNQ